MRQALFLLLLAPFVIAADAEPPAPKAAKPREVTGIKGRLASKFEFALNPVKITSEADLAKAVPSKADQAALQKAVDFRKEYLLIVTWAGSGGDRLAFEVKKAKPGPEVVFTRHLGETDDYNEHQKVYVISKSLTYRFEK